MNALRSTGITILFVIALEVFTSDDDGVDLSNKKSVLSAAAFSHG